MAQSKASSWHPYNVEPTEEAEVEVDDTQEIQIEEALKLYQTALKHHSEGPASFDTTAKAYKELFESDIFKYTESLSEYQRHELYGDTLVFDSILEDDFETGPVQATGAADSAPNTLPQLLHLSYKNHGRFLLEAMQYWITEHGPVAQKEEWTTLHNSLNYFAEALDKEDIDLDLWLRAASVAAMLGSKRLARYCLEAVLDGNDEQWESLLQLPGLEEAFAGQQLRELVERMEDNVSLMQAPLLLMKRKQLSETLKKRLNPFPFAPLPAAVAEMDKHHSADTLPESLDLNPSKWDWAGVGDVILQQFLAEQRGLAPNVPPGSRVTFNIPPDSESLTLIETESNTSVQPVLTASPEHSNQTSGDQSQVSATKAETSPARAGEDVEMEERNGSAELKAEDAESTAPLEQAPVPSRKRSMDSAGLPETAEGGRSRSKRIRGRESIYEASGSGGRVAQEANKQLDDQLERYTHADQCLYEIVKDIYQRLSVEGAHQPTGLRSLLNALPDTPSNAFEKAACDMYTALQGGNSKAAQIIMSNESFDLVGVTREAGLNAFLGFAKATTGQTCAKPLLERQQLSAFVRSINEEWLSIKEVAFAWMEALLFPSSFSSQHDDPVDKQSSYMKFTWAEDLKRHLVQVIVHLDDYIHERMLGRISDLNKRMLKALTEGQSYELSDFDASHVDIIQTLFELHLDIYSLIKHPHSQVDAVTQILQSDRLERWSILARDAIQLRTSCQSSLEMDDLALRHIWASVFRMSVRDDMLPEHIISAMGELKSIFQALDGHTIQVQNNAIMPELTVAAIDRELVRISMKDFFLKVFDEDEKDPVAVIESLEPILEEDKPAQPNTESDSEDEFVDARTSPVASNQPDSPTAVHFERPSPVLEMRKFLDGANVNVRLSLWHRLREAYDSIEYPPKVVSCYLRSIETLVKDFKSSQFQELSLQERQIKLLTRFRVVDDMVVKILQVIRDDKSAFDCLTYEHLQSSMSAIAELLYLLAAGNMFRDLVRINHVSVPRFEGMPSSTFVNMTNKLDDIHVRLWMLQYHLLKEGISQNPESFPTPSEDLFEFLRHVHHATGVRNFCHFSTRQFLRLTRDELLRFDNIVDANSHDTELCQVLSDLYGLKLFIEPLDCQDFQTTPDALDKKTALSILSFVMAQAKKVDLKDLLKTELKGTIEKVHAAFGRPKTNESISFNRKLISAYFKSSVSPVSLFNCLKGVGSLPTKTISPEEAVAASKGWYYLMGDIALSKFRSQKRMTQGPTEDLNYAQAFFVQDLEFSIENWKTWYRLAQANDTQLEEAVSWNADKLNSNTVELINFQRAAINCYIMAVACAVRDADATPESLDEMARMYTEFGNRIYAASREPFSMEAFQIRETEKRFCNNQSQVGTYKDVPFIPLQVYAAWKFAGTLFKRAIKGNPSKWWNHYMLGKCGWKMWSMNDNADRYAMSIGAPRPIRHGPNWTEVIDAIISAIETLPEKKGRSGEPILEPHYKLVSITHKLFQRRAIDHTRGLEILAHTSFTQNVNSPENADDWERYVLAVLKALRAADKSSWHHRIIARSAHIIYDEGKDTMLAMAAKHELTQQIFTKTMSVQVWKPENERPGRHFVYTTRYTKFFVELLDLTRDKANYEALAKRVRKKQTDFFEHQKLWQDMVLRYLKLLRRIGKVVDGQEDSAFKSVNHEEFNTLALRLEAWCQNPATQHPVLDVLRDAIEFKRLNNGLIKPLLIDDLIGDAYAMLYTSIVPTLPPLPSEIPEPPPALPPQPLPPAPFIPPLPPPGSVPISSLMSVQIDGPADAKPSTIFSIYHPAQLQPQPPIPQPQIPPPAEPPKPRAKAVGRREIARRAEAASQKPAGAVAPHTTAIPIRSPPTLNATLASLDEQTIGPEKSEQPTPPSISTDHLQAPASFDKSGTATAAASVSNASPERSAPASVNDDADDESELSELDDEEVQEIEQEVQEVENEALRRSSSIATIKPLFPNLLANRSSPEKKSETQERAPQQQQQDTAMKDSGDPDTIHIVVPKVQVEKKKK